MQLVLSLTPGGTERLVIELVRRLTSPSVQFVVCCLDDEGAWADELSRIGVPIVALRRTPGFSPGLGRRIARLVSEHGVQVIHCHHYSPFVYGQLGAVLERRARVVFTEHGRLSDAPPSRKRRLVNPFLGRLPDQIFAVSADLRRHMIAEGFPASRVQVLHNGIDPGPETTGARRCAARASLGAQPDELIVGSVARLDPVKDLHTLVDAFVRLVRRVPRSKLVLVGDGPERDSLQAHAVRAGIHDRVVLTGYREDVRALLPGFDIYANSSIHEGVSLTILEAMASSVPVVATAVGGNPEVVNSETGVLVPCGSPDAAGAALIALAEHPERRSDMGAAARGRVKALFTMERMVSRYLASYHRSAGMNGGIAENEIALPKTGSTRGVSC
jgi:glycosyltransferase involved in cell wall biosynthesis